jgi:drug/metabolite transporter (DMT)-like permease
MSYLAVVVVWTTTPIAVKYSSLDVGFIQAVSVRVIVAALIAFVLLKILNKPLIVSRRDWVAYAAGALALFPTMLLVYFAAQFLDSGLISVLFGLSPFFVGVFSIVILRQNPFNRSRLIALVISLAGLTLINISQLGLDNGALIGLLTMLLSVALFALSTVALKASAVGMEPIRQMSGSLIVAAPFFAVSMLFSDGLPREIGILPLFALGYLVVFGSIIAGIAFVYVLSRCEVVTVSLIPLITPVFAIVLGFFVANERMGLPALLGSGLILFSLAVYQGVFKTMFTRVHN